MKVKVRSLTVVLKNQVIFFCLMTYYENSKFIAEEKKGTAPPNLNFPLPGETGPACLVKVTILFTAI